MYIIYFIFIGKHEYSLEINVVSSTNKFSLLKNDILNHITNT